MNPVHASRRLVRAGLLSLAMLLPQAVLVTASRADLLPYTQNFDGMTTTDALALSGDGWLVYGNVFDPAMNYLYGYGPYPAPNGGPPAFCLLVNDQGGPTQGTNQLSVFSDYENLGHAAGNWVESNVFQERTVGAGDVGKTWYLEFDAKLGNLGGSSTALAFIKTLAPPTYALTNFITADMTAIPTTWGRYQVALTIDAGLVGQVFQFGFANTATNYESSGIFYDNVQLTEAPTVDVPGARTTGGALQLSALGNPARADGSHALSFDLPEEGPVSLRVYDVTGALVTTLVEGTLAAGPHQATWNGRDDEGRTVPAGLYLASVRAGTRLGVVKLSRLH